MVGTNQLLIPGSSLVEEEKRNRLFATFVPGRGGEGVHTRAARQFPMISRTSGRYDYVIHRCK